jgi:ABC-2 type transport system ATP-binding protein
LFALGLTLNVLLCVLGPIVLARLVRARYPLAWSTFGLGALAFIASQVVHLPLNAWLMPHLRGAHLWVVASVVGLSAGLCEESARYLVMRLRKGERSGPHALAFGVGHGGIESLLIGFLAATTLFNVLFIERIGVAQLGLDADTEASLTRQLAELRHMGALTPLWGALERMLVIPAHIALSCLVMRSVAQKKPLLLVLAVALHALLDGLCVAVGERFSPEMAEVFLAFTVPISLALILTSLRALPRLDKAVEASRPAVEGAPIELVHAHKTYGAVKAVDDISFTLAPGERAALLGPNGAGKTTTIRMITGAVAPSQGFVFLFGDTSQDATFLDKKKRVGIVPQQPGMYAEMTVRSYLDFVRDVYAAPNADLEVAQKLGLEGVLDRPTSALSGGMQRRLALAAALLPRPDLLVLDEPSAGLDPVAGRQMIACVKEASVGRTTLLCTHNLAEAEALCDSVIILRQGKVVLHTRLDELRKRTETRVALRTQGDASSLCEALAARGHTPSLIDGEVCIPLADAEHAVPTLLRELLQEGFEVFECRIVRPSLEELFFQVLGDASSTETP